MDYQEYKEDFLNTLRADSVHSGTDTEDEFLNHTLDLLMDFNELDSPEMTGMGDKKGKGGRLMRADGYCFDETDHSLILLISDFQDSREPDKLTRTRVDELYWRLYYFLDEVCNGNISTYFDDSDDVLKISDYIRRRMNAQHDDPQLVLKVKFYILTNKELDTRLLSTNLLETTISNTRGKKKKAKTTKKIKKENFNGKPLEIALWYPERFFEMENSNNNEPIVIDVAEDYGCNGIPCIKGNIGDNLDYEAYIAIIPGKLLADIYIEHGSRVLEGNVRAFLGTGGSKSVNSGIRRTINTDPTKFFTYNNGIATTASDVETNFVDGQLYITKIVDLQIINGGQTTASLAEAVLKKTNTDLKGIYVPMKLTVIDDRESEDENGIRFYDAMVQSIAKFANSQNKVTAADLFSNDPFHIQMEQMSKRYLAPPGQSAVPTGWYYERSRKKYKQEQIKLSKDSQKRFQSKFPKSQVITKEQLAMYITTVFSLRPDIVSKGKNWTMKAFGTEISEIYKKNKEAFNEFYFKKCICAAIIYRTVDSYLETHKDSARKPTGFWYKTGGYKLNIVPYSIAKIISSIPEGLSLDWTQIWNKQAISPSFMREIEIVTKMTNDFICDSNGVIVTEYCKKLSTWEEFRDKIGYSPSADFLSELISTAEVKEYEHDAKSDKKDDNNLKNIMAIINRGADYWQNLVRIAQNNRISVSYQELTAIKQLIDMSVTGKLPITSSGKVPSKVTKAVQLALALEDKLKTEGLLSK
ncbi:AIPR family protein [uncultured Ruminococcus sp.]|uniref:AIPR family protein n=1 Tax=Ruminococcus bromii TaxID=40518 RepID=UPI000821BCFD|nr:AIPR family protein [uncultured Ruminococcus sp.]SCJ11835.1 AIPR protein [uncultured Ruminococcus sp.]